MSQLKPAIFPHCWFVFASLLNVYECELNSFEEKILLVQLIFNKSMLYGPALADE